MYSNFVFLDRFLFELSCKHTHTHTDSNEYPIVAFSKNATITSLEDYQSIKGKESKDHVFWFRDLCVVCSFMWSFSFNLSFTFSLARM